MGKIVLSVLLLLGGYLGLWYVPSGGVVSAACADEVPDPAPDPGDPVTTGGGSIDPDG